MLNGDGEQRARAAEEIAGGVCDRCAAPQPELEREPDAPTQTPSELEAGWRHDQIRAVWEDLDSADCPKDAAAVRNLLADRDRLERERDTARSELARLRETLRAALDGDR
jgi:hypothetical protein